MDLIAVREILKDKIGINKRGYMFSKIQLEKGWKGVSLLYSRLKVDH